MGLRPTCKLCKAHDEHIFNLNRDLCESTPTCHSEGTERPKNLISRWKYEILRFTQDDKMALGRGLTFELFQAEVNDYRP